MAKQLIAVHNSSNAPITVVNSETSANTATIEADSFVTMRWDIPDNSNPSEYFSGHHMEIRDTDGRTLFSFWGDDHEDYNLKYCVGTDWENTTAYMTGYYGGGNGAPVLIVVSGTEREDIQAVKYS